MPSDEEKKEAPALLQASFRDVAFHVTSTELTAGRRTVLHEYPQRDKPYVEDIGRASRKLTFTAFIVGDDYIKQAQKLLAAIEEPGPGKLVHPHFGEMQASLTAESTLSFTTERRIATIKLTAVESGDLEFPKETQDTTDAALEAADEVEKSAIQEFCDSIDLSCVSEWVDAALSGDLLDKLGIISSADLAAIFDKVDEISSLAQKGLSLISMDPKVFASNLMGALGLSRVASSARAWSRVAKQLKNLTKHEKMSSGTKALAKAKAEGTVLSDVQSAVMHNRAAVETLIRQSLIAQMVGVSALIGTKNDQLPPIEDDVVTSETLKETVTLEAIDAELLMTTNDDSYLALEKARVAVFEVLTEKANRRGRVYIVEPGEVLPALVHAYDYHDDAARDQEIVIRNAVEHEGFCSADSLKVMADE